MSADNARNRYLADAVATATPARRLVMLFDRLWLDVQRGQAALATGDTTAARDQIGHAQLIVSELLGSLDVTAWDGAGNLADVYGFLLNEFIGVIVNPVAGKLDACVGIIAKLREAWQQAEVALNTPAVPATTPATDAASSSRSMAWVS